MTFVLPESYEAALGNCGFVTSHMAERYGGPVDRLFPGSFLRSGSLDPVEDDDAPYSWIATDKRFGDSLEHFVWLSPYHLPRTGKHRLDRVAHLAIFVKEATLALRANTTSPIGGLLADGETPPLGAVYVRYPNGQTWCSRYRGTHPQYPCPLSVFGQLKCFGPLLQEKARALLSHAPLEFNLDALAAIAAAAGHPLFWPDVRIAELDRVGVEIMRYAAKWPTFPVCLDGAGKVVAEMAAPPAKAGAAAPTKKPKRRRSPIGKQDRPLTPNQSAVLLVVSRHMGNFAAAAQELGKDRKTIEETWQVANAKVAKLLGSKSRSVGTVSMPLDRRDQANVSKKPRG